MEFKNPSSRDFGTFLKNIKADDKKVLLILPTEESAYNTFLSARNFSNVLPVAQTEITLDDILNSDRIIFTEEVVKHIEGVLL
jgi:large subunit ribosomal protein L4